MATINGTSIEYTTKRSTSSQVIRVGVKGEGDRACPNRAEVDGYCSWHDQKFRKGRPDPEPAPELFTEATTEKE